MASFGVKMARRSVATALPRCAESRAHGQALWRAMSLAAIVVVIRQRDRDRDPRRQQSTE